MKLSVSVVIILVLAYVVNASVLDPVIENVVHKQATKPPDGVSGIWKKKTIWKPRWVKEWKSAKVMKPIWKKIWSPVQIREWVPLPKPPPDWSNKSTPLIPVKVKSIPKPKLVPSLPLWDPVPYPESQQPPPPPPSPEYYPPNDCSKTGCGSGAFSQDQISSIIGSHSEPYRYSEEYSETMTHLTRIRPHELSEYLVPPKHQTSSDVKNQILSENYKPLRGHFVTKAPQVLGFAEPRVPQNKTELSQNPGFQTHTNASPIGPDFIQAAELVGEYHYSEFDLPEVGRNQPQKFPEIQSIGLKGSFENHENKARPVRTDNRPFQNFVEGFGEPPDFHSFQHYQEPSGPSLPPTLTSLQQLPHSNFIEHFHPPSASSSYFQNNHPTLSSSYNFETSSSNSTQSPSSSNGNFPQHFHPPLNQNYKPTASRSVHSSFLSYSSSNQHHQNSHHRHQNPQSSFTSNGGSPIISNKPHNHLLQSGSFTTTFQHSHQYSPIPDQTHHHLPPSESFQSLSASPQNKPFQHSQLFPNTPPQNINLQPGAHLQSPFLPSGGGPTSQTYNHQSPPSRPNPQIESSNGSSKTKQLNHSTNHIQQHHPNPNAASQHPHKPQKHQSQQITHPPQHQSLASNTTLVQLNQLNTPTLHNQHSHFSISASSRQPQRSLQQPSLSRPTQNNSEHLQHHNIQKPQQHSVISNLIQQTQVHPQNSHQPPVQNRPGTKIQQYQSAINPSNQHQAPTTIRPVPIMDAITPFKPLPNASWNSPQSLKLNTITPLKPLPQLTSSKPPQYHITLFTPSNDKNETKAISTQIFPVYSTTQSPPKLVTTIQSTPPQALNLELKSTTSKLDLDNEIEVTENAKTPKTTTPFRVYPSSFASSTENTTKSEVFVVTPIYVAQS